MFEDPEGELVCVCGHRQSMHKRKGKGVCTYHECMCEKFKGTGAVLPVEQPPESPKPPPPPPPPFEPGAVHFAVLHLLRSCGPVTDETLMFAYMEAVKKRTPIIYGGEMLMPEQLRHEVPERREELTEAAMVIEHDRNNGRVRWKVNDGHPDVRKILQNRSGVEL